MRPSGERPGPTLRMGRPDSGPGSHGLDMSGPTPSRRAALGLRGAPPPDRPPPPTSCRRWKSSSTAPRGRAWSESDSPRAPWEPPGPEEMELAWCPRGHHSNGSCGIRV